MSCYSLVINFQTWNCCIKRRHILSEDSLLDLTLPILLPMARFSSSCICQLWYLDLPQQNYMKIPGCHPPSPLLELQLKGLHTWSSTTALRRNRTDRRHHWASRDQSPCGVKMYWFVSIKYNRTEDTEMICHEGRNLHSRIPITRTHTESCRATWEAPGPSGDKNEGSRVWSRAHLGFSREGMGKAG